MNSLSYLFWAYVTVWAGLAVFLWIHHRRLRAVDRRLDRIESEDARRSADSPAAR